MRRLVTFALLLLASAAPAQQIAAQYREAARQARAAAAASCPADRGCYLALAQYSDCQANQLSPGGARCVPPSCQTGNCAAKPQGGGGAPGSAFPTPPQPPGLVVFNAAASQLQNLIMAGEQARRNRDAARLDQARQLWQLQQLRVAENERFVEAVNRELHQEVDAQQRELSQLEAEAARARAERIRAAAQTAPAVIPVSTALLPDGPVPANGSRHCEPFRAMKDGSGGVFTDLDIAFCAVASELETAFPRDIAHFWLVRNRGSATRTVKYQLSIQCISACTSGWYGFSDTIEPGQTAGDGRRFNAYQLVMERVVGIQ